MPNFYYSNPQMGVGVSNLAEAMVGDPLTGVQAGLLGDRRRTEQVQRRKLEAEALSEEFKNRELEAARQQIAAMVGAMAGQVPEAGRPAAAANLEYLARVGLGSGSNANQTSNAITDAMTLALAQGDDSQQRQALIAQGKQPTQDFAGTAVRADELNDAKYDASYAQAMGVAGTNNAGAMAREQLQEGGRNARHVTGEAGKNTRAGKKLAAGGAGGKPMKVGGADVKAISELLSGQVAAAGGEDAYLDPATEQALLQAIGAAFQQTGNLPGAVQEGWAQVMGLEPGATPEGALNPFVENRTKLTPGTGFVPSAGAPAAAGGRVQITTEAEWAALPSGAKYLDPNGNPRTKP